MIRPADQPTRSALIGEDTMSPAASRLPAEIDDVTFARTIGVGAIIGIPVTFMVVFAAMLLATGIPGVAPAIAWTAIVGGAYFGGFVALNVVVGEMERLEHAQPTPLPRPAGMPVSGTRAA